MKVLLIAGGGTLGGYACEELLKRGCEVDVICLEDRISDCKNLKFYKKCADLAFLNDFLSDKFYDGIVNFIHYNNTEEYKNVHTLLSKKTNHLIFLSSYRVYSDKQIPITEAAPQLYDISDDEEFLNSEDYAVPKSKNEKYIINDSGTKNWTIVRPVISFSYRRFDIISVFSGQDIIKYSKTHEPIFLPSDARNLTAGLDWAGNTGKLIALLLLTDKSMGEAYTVSSGQNLKWCEIADIYTKLLGLRFEWVEMREYLERLKIDKIPWGLKYDRMFERNIDCSKIMNATGMKKSDFQSIEYGIKTEINNLRRFENESNTCKR